jgi:hypothetical protein
MALSLAQKRAILSNRVKRLRAVACRIRLYAARAARANRHLTRTISTKKSAADHAPPSPDFQNRSGEVAARKRHATRFNPLKLN